MKNTNINKERVEAKEYLQAKTDIMKAMQNKGQIKLFDNSKFRGYGKTTFLNIIVESGVYKALGYDDVVILKNNMTTMDVNNYLRGCQNRLIVLDTTTTTVEQDLKEVIKKLTDKGCTVIGFVDSVTLEEANNTSFELLCKKCGHTTTLNDIKKPVKIIQTGDGKTVSVTISFVCPTCSNNEKMQISLYQ